MKHLITNNNECVEKSEIKIENVIPEIEKNEKNTCENRIFCVVTGVFLNYRPL